MLGELNFLALFWVKFLFEKGIQDVSDIEPFSIFSLSLPPSVRVFHFVNLQLFRLLSFL